MQNYLKNHVSGSNTAIAALSKLREDVLGFSAQLSENLAESGDWGDNRSATWIAFQYLTTQASQLKSLIAEVKSLEPSPAIEIDSTVASENEPIAAEPQLSDQGINIQLRSLEPVTSDFFEPTYSPIQLKNSNGVICSGDTLVGVLRQYCHLLGLKKIHDKKPEFTSRFRITRKDNKYTLFLEPKETKDYGRILRKIADCLGIDCPTLLDTRNPYRQLN